MKPALCSTRRRACEPPPARDGRPPRPSPADAERSRVTGYRGIRQLLRRPALDDDAIERAVEELHEGRTVVLVDVPEIAPVETDAQLEQMAKAA
jgi:hypothetical protein